MNIDVDVENGSELLLEMLRLRQLKRLERLRQADPEGDQKNPGSIRFSGDNRPIFQGTAYERMMCEPDSDYCDQDPLVEELEDLPVEPSDYDY